jgi:hypothetical protein
MMCGLESGVLSVTNSEEADATILMERPVIMGTTHATHSISEPKGCSNHKSLKFVGYIDQSCIGRRFLSFNDQKI